MTVLLARPFRDVAFSRPALVPATSLRARTPVPPSSCAPVRASASAAATASPSKALASDGFSDGPLVAKPLGPAVRPPQQPAEIEAMSPAALKGFTGEQVLGMTRDQFRKFQDAVMADGGPGVMALDPMVRKAIIRKGFLQEILDMCRAQQERHAFCAW